MTRIIRTTTAAAFALLAGALENSKRQTIYGVAWKLADRVPPIAQAVDIAFKLVWNHFNGRRLLQMELLDWRATD